MQAHTCARGGVGGGPFQEQVRRELGGLRALLHWAGCESPDSQGTIPVSTLYKSLAGCEYQCFV